MEKGLRLGERVIGVVAAIMSNKGGELIILRRSKVSFHRLSEKNILDPFS